VSDENKPGITVDEARKSQVEREPADREPAEPTADSPSLETPPAESPSASPEAARQRPHAHALPPASLSLLMTSLGTQALIALGQIPNPMTGKAGVERELARHTIDLLNILEAKTAGNRTSDESQLLDELLYELRMLFVKSGK
jgi:hypothetical protein